VAGINGAVNGRELGGGDEMLPVGSGLFSPLARAQYGALVRLRWHIFVNGLRTKVGAFEFGARTVSYFIYGLMGVGMAFGAGGIAYGLASDGQWNYMPAVFWFVLLTWQVVPIMLASFQEQFNLGSLLRFPVSFRSFYFLYVVFGLSDVSTAIGALCSLGILVGITVVRPDLFGFTVLILFVFAVFNVLLVRAVFAWIDRWLSQRKTREIMAALFMILFLSFQLVNPAVWQHDHNPAKSIERPDEQVQHMMESRWVKGANAVQAWLPPGLAGRALHDASSKNPVRGLGMMAVIGLYVLAAGGLLGVRLRAEFSGEDLSSAPGLKAAAAAMTKSPAGRAKESANAWRIADGDTGTTPVFAAIAAKEFHSLLRSLPLLYAVGAPLLMVLVISGTFLRGGASTQAPIYAFPLCVFFGQVGFHQLWGNNLGTEGAGIQLYYLSPTPFRTVMLAKNLFHALVFATAMVIGALLATVRLGVPSLLTLSLTAAWLLMVLPVNLAVGNIFSLTMPYRVNPGRISRQKRSQGAAFLSLLLQLGLVGVGALVYLLTSHLEMTWMAVPVFLAIAAVATLVWLRILENSDNIANQRKDQLIAALTKVDE
jgi:ABC-2 type transport system permease protein